MSSAYNILDGIYTTQFSPLSFKELLTGGIACHYMLLTPSQLIVSRLTLINSGRHIVKMFIAPINVILPELETEVLVINIFLSILIEKS